MVDLRFFADCCFFRAVSSSHKADSSTSSMPPLILLMNVGQLRGDFPIDVIDRDLLGEADDVDRELLRAGFESFWSHAPFGARRVPI
jgi:hypothetical protein